MKITRRSFVKKSSYTAAAVTVLGCGVGLGEDPSSPPPDEVEWEYALRCVKDPAHQGRPEVKFYHNGVFAAGDVTNFLGDMGVKVMVMGQGPEKGGINGFFNFRGFIRGWVSDDIDDGTPLNATPPESTDADADDIAYETINTDSNAAGAMVLGISTLTLTDGETGQCSWSPDPIRITEHQGTASVGWQQPTLDVATSGVIKPIVELSGSCSVDTPEVTSTQNTNLTIEWASVGDSLQTKKPSSTRTANQHINWTIDVVKREKDTYNDPHEGWQYHCAVSLDPYPKSA